jgi:hypothetical protein
MQALETPSAVVAPLPSAAFAPSAGPFVTRPSHPARKPNTAITTPRKRPRWGASTTDSEFRWIRRNGKQANGIVNWQSSKSRTIANIRNSRGKRGDDSASVCHRRTSRPQRLGAARGRVYLGRECCGASSRERDACRPRAPRDHFSSRGGGFQRLSSAVVSASARAAELRTWSSHKVLCLLDGAVLTFCVGEHARPRARSVSFGRDSDAAPAVSAGRRGYRDPCASSVAGVSRGRRADDRARRHVRRRPDGVRSTARAHRRDRRVGASFGALNGTPFGGVADRREPAVGKYFATVS